MSQLPAVLCAQWTVYIKETLKLCKYFLNNYFSCTVGFNVRDFSCKNIRHIVVLLLVETVKPKNMCNLFSF